MCDSCPTNENKKTVDFVHLHNHSEYSLLDGLSSVAELAQTASNLNFPGIALTDHGSCGGLYAFQKECVKNKIKPILGAELYITKNHWDKDKSTKTNHILLLAKDDVGLKNLFQLSSIAEIEGKYRKPRIDMELLQKYHKGLICTSGCPASEIPMAISQGNIPQAKELMGKYKELFKDDFYVEIMTHKYFNNPEQEQREIANAKQLLELAKEFNVKALATNDVHYARKDQWADQDLMLAMQTGDTIKNPDRFTFGSDEFYIKTYDEMMLCYKERPDILTNTMEIFDKVQSGLIKRSEDLLPHFDLPEGYADEKAYLKDLVRDGMARMGFINNQVYRDRIKFEMNAIITCGYTRYFLILWDIINFAKSAGINIGIGRGCFTPENKVACINGEKAICDVCVGDFVLAYDGKYHAVEKTMEYEIDEEIIDIELDDGRTISCTKDHKIHVNRNGVLVWVQACELTLDDDIYEITVSKL